MIVLAQPLALVLLAAPVLLHFLLPPLGQQRSALRAPFIARLSRILGTEPGRGQLVLRASRTQRLLAAVVWGLLVLGVARPQRIGEPVEKRLPTRDLLLAVDLSGSMDAADFAREGEKPIQRLAAVRKVLGDFLVRREGDRVGLLFFGSAAFVQAPFTEDLGVCRSLLDEARVGMAGPKTVLGDAIGLAIKMFEESELERRTLIVLTDGNDTSSLVPPRKAAAIAADRGITIHAVSIGDPEATGEEKLDVATLESIAKTTGGRVFHGTNQEELERIYAELDRLETREVESLSHRPRFELFHWPLGLVVLLVLGFQGVSLLSSWRRHVG